MKDVSATARKTNKANATKGKSWIMKDKVFKIKIADLLNESWKEDQIYFDHKFSDQLPNLDADGMAGTFTIHSLDTTSLLGTLTDITASFHEICESCGTAFDRRVEIPLYTARFVFEDDISEKEKTESEESLLYIDPKDETINIEDMSVQAILLNDPFVKRCPKCTKRLEAEHDDDDDLGEYVSTWNITFS
jgi:uncharacterized metal-binding protein YceD (DUF177 family)